jgi:hypothetical protein
LAAEKSVRTIREAILMHRTAEHGQSTNRERRGYERGQSKGRGGRHYRCGESPNERACDRQHSHSAGKPGKGDWSACRQSQRQAGKKT